MKALKVKHNGIIKRYNLNCGHVQKYTISNGLYNVEVKMFQNGCYHVETYVYKIVAPYKGCLGIKTNEELHLRGKELRSYSLTECRKRFSKMKQVARRYLSLKCN